MRQGRYESLVSYKARFDSTYESYKELLDATLQDEYVAMDFPHSSDANRFGSFISNIVNDISIGAILRPQDLNTVYRAETSQRRSGTVYFINVSKSRIPSQPRKN